MGAGRTAVLQRAADPQLLLKFLLERSRCDKGPGCVPWTRPKSLRVKAVGVVERGQE